MGFRSLYDLVKIPRKDGSNLGDIVLRPLPMDLEGTEVVGEAVPLQIRCR